MLRFTLATLDASFELELLVRSFTVTLALHEVVRENVDGLPFWVYVTLPKF